MEERKEPDHGTPELKLRLRVEVKNNVARIWDQTPLDRYLREDLITEQQFLAGQKLHCLFEFSGGVRMKTHKLSDERGESTNENNTSKYWHKYLSTVRNLSHMVRPVTINVCCYQETVANPLALAKLQQGLLELAEILRV